tara:strand:- start:22361 stop:22621 length:261 start_codon:yes stop_codon:yes gene_type:complete
MKRKQRIQKLLNEHFNQFIVDIKDNSHLHKGHNSFDGNNETHILIVIRISHIYKVNRLSLHRKINQLLKKEFENGLHSIQIKIIQF